MSGMKVYLTDEKELIMEPSIKWAGNPNVSVAVKAFGLKATAQVIGLVYCARKNFYYLCVCVCVCACVRERERERESYTASLHCLVSMISGGGFASICCSTYYSEALGSKLSLFCQYPCVSHG